MNIRYCLGAAALLIAAPLAAQDHGAQDHARHDHSGEASPQPESEPTPGPAPGPTMVTPPPPAAGSGPPRAADAIWGAETMRASRNELRRTHGDFPILWFQADRLETQFRDGANGYLWDVQGYYGTPTRRLWIKSEGEGEFGGELERGEVQALYSHGFAPFFDVQMGVRQDFGPDGTTHGVIGVQGLAPYMFELDAALFLSHRGDLTARVELELDQRITQRLILQPRAEVNLAAQDVPELGIGAGLDRFEVGVRLRYEIIREFAPFVGVEHSWRAGRSADFARAAGMEPAKLSLLAGIRLWF
ncbi:MAG: copper resistance protein B [Erythrobacter sp.]